jgi:septum formation protein
MQKIILASGSPRRSQLLQWAEIPFDVRIAATDESYPNILLPYDIAIHIAFHKALAVQEIIKQNDTGNEANTILAADTIVVLENKIIGKPASREDAISILSALSGKVHQVITGVCILTAKEKIEFAEETLVEFHELSLSQIEFYVDKYKPFDKAGAYAIQEWIGVIGVKSITGDFYNVMGLPVSKVVKELEKIAIDNL